MVGESGLLDIVCLIEVELNTISNRSEELDKVI